MPSPGPSRRPLTRSMRPLAPVDTNLPIPSSTNPNAIPVHETPRLPAIRPRMLSTSTEGSSEDEESDSTLSDLSSMSATGLNSRPMVAIPPPLAKGSIYADKDTARAAVALHSFGQGGASIRTKASNSRRLILVCCEAGEEQQGCAYRIYLRQVNGGQEMVVRSLRDTHTCSVDVIPPRTVLKQRWFVSQAVNALNDVQMATKPMQIAANVGKQYGYKPSYHTVYQVRLHLRQDDITAHNNAFRKLPSYIDKLKDGDPNGHYVLKRSGNIITQAFIAPFPSRAAFSSLPPSFSVDGCHSRAINDYTLLMATAHDADSHIVVLAWGHCYGESIETWTWFLGQLKDAYPHLNQPHRSLISDRDKGIAYAAETVFPLVHHLHCTQHIKENVKTRFGQEISRLFPSLVHSESRARFQAQLEVIKGLNEGAADYIDAIPHDRWARYAVKTSRFGYTTSNVAEQTNAWLRSHRAGTIIHLYDAIWSWQASQYQIRAAKAHQIATRVVPKAKTFLDEQKRQSVRYLATITMENESTILARADPLDHTNPRDHQRSIVLHLQTNHAECSCPDASDWSLPCRHIIAVCSTARMAPRRFIHKCHLTATYQATYLVRFPVILTDSLDIDDDIQPPLMRSGKGRRQQKRYRPGDRPSAASQARRPAPPSRTESQASQVLAGEAMRLRKCGRCGRMAGHNARTCQEPLELQEDVENDLY